MPSPPQPIERRLPRVLCILNPASAAGRTGARANDLLAALAPACGEIAVRATEGPGHAVALARELGGEWPCVLVGGGDGTVSEVANGLIEGGHDPLIALLPAGSGSDFARNLGIVTLEQGLAALAEGRETRIDAAIATLTTASGACERAFVLTTGTGFSPRVIATATRRWKRVFRAQSYTVAGIVAAVGYRVPRMRLTIDGETVAGRCFNVVVANAELESGGARMSPGARLDDGLLHVGAALEATALGGLRAMASIGSGRHVDSPRYLYRTARAVTIESDPPVGVQVDGEVPGTTPVSFHVLPGRLRVLAPVR